MIGTRISNNGLYRYTLDRDLFAGEGTVAFIMLNPSTADATQDDPTIRRCIGYGISWGFQKLLVGNLFALRATKPIKLLAADDPVGPENDRWLREIANEADLVVCAWGAHKLAAKRAREAVLPGELTALKVTASGQPGHPLYLKKDLQPVKFEVPK